MDTPVTTFPFSHFCCCAWTCRSTEVCCPRCRISHVSVPSGPVYDLRFPVYERVDRTNCDCRLDKFFCLLIQTFSNCLTFKKLSPKENWSSCNVDVLIDDLDFWIDNNIRFMFSSVNRILKSSQFIILLPTKVFLPRNHSFQKCCVL